MKKNILSVISAFVLTLAANAGVVYVNVQANGANNGTSWADAYTSLSAAGSNMNTLNGDSLFVAAGTYYVPASDQILLNANIRVFGGFPATGNPTWTDRDWILFPTVCDGDNNQDDDGTWQTRTDNAKRIFVIDTYAELNGLTVRNGGDASGGSGAGVALNGATSREARIIDCVFEYNSCTTSPFNDLAGQGGAIRGVAINLTDTLYCENVTFRGNKAYEGGAIAVQGEAILKNCKFLNNTGARGSAIVQFGVSGSIPFRSGTFHCTNSIFYNNEAVNLPNAGTVVRINNLDSDMTFTNCTFKQNITSNGEGTILTEEGGGSTSSQVTYANCLFDQGMPGSNPFFGINEGNYNFYNCIHNYISQGDFLGEIDPSSSVNIVLDSTNLMANASIVFETSDPANGLFILDCTSPGIDYGNDIYYGNLPMEASSAVDLASNARISGLSIDAGAFETQTTPLDYNVSLNGGTLEADEQNATSYQWVDCENNNAPISGATSQSFTPTVTGEYACELANDCFSGITSCQAVTVIGIDEIEMHSFKVYPNPAKASLSIKNYNQNIGMVRIIDVTGKIIEVQPTAEGVINVSSLTQGMYTVSIVENEEMISIRFIKE